MKFALPHPAISLTMAVIGAGLLIAGVVIYPYSPGKASAQEAHCKTGATDPSYPTATGAQTYASHWKAVAWLMDSVRTSTASNPEKVAAAVGPSKWLVSGVLNDNTGSKVCYNETWTLQKVIYSGRNINVANSGQIIEVGTTPGGFGGSLAWTKDSQVSNSVDSVVGDNHDNFYLSAGTYGVIPNTSNNLDYTHSLFPYEWTVSGGYGQ